MFPEALACAGGRRSKSQRGVGSQDIGYKLLPMKDARQRVASCKPWRVGPCQRLRLGFQLIKLFTM